MYTQKYIFLKELLSHHLSQCVFDSSKMLSRLFQTILTAMYFVADQPMCQWWTENIWCYISCFNAIHSCANNRSGCLLYLLTRLLGSAWICSYIWINSC